MHSWFKSLAIVFLVLAGTLAQGWAQPHAIAGVSLHDGQLSAPVADNDALVPEPVRLVAFQTDDDTPRFDMAGRAGVPLAAGAEPVRCRNIPLPDAAPAGCLLSAAAPRAPPAG